MKRRDWVKLRDVNEAGFLSPFYMRFLIAFLVVIAAVSEAAAQASAEVQRKPVSTIRGVVTYADTGHPVRYTSVNLVSNDSGEWQRDAVTNGRGQFEFADVDAGRYILYVDAPGILKPQNYSRNMGPVAAQLRLNEKRDLFTEVVVNGTDLVEVKVQAVRGGVITGRVVADDDQPIPNAEVRLLRRENDEIIPVWSTWRRSSSDKNQGKTDPSGAYRIAGLESGEYIVRVSEPSMGYDEASPAEGAYHNGSQMVAYYPSATAVKAAQTVSVVEGSETSGIDIRMPDRIPRTISGTVTYGPNNQPAGWLSILIDRPDELGLDRVPEATARTDGEGKWQMPGVPAGEYVLYFSGSTRIGPPDTAGSHVYIAPKQMNVTVANDDVVLNTHVDAGAMVYGTIKFDGPPPESLFNLRPAVVLATEGQERLPKNLTPPRGYESAYVRDEAKFEIKELAAGKYWFVMSGFAPDKYYVKSVTRNGTDVTQSPINLATGAKFGEVIVALGTDMATIEGQVADVKPRTPSRDVVVMLAPANDATRRFSPGVLTTQPDAQNRFVFACGPGEYFLTVVTRAEREKLPSRITEDYFKQDNQKFLRVKVKAGERLKGVTLP